MNTVNPDQPAVKPTVKARILAAVKKVAHSSVAVYVAGIVSRNAKAIAAFLAPFVIRYLAARFGIQVSASIAQQVAENLILAGTVWVIANRPAVATPADK